MRLEHDAINTHRTINCDQSATACHQALYSSSNASSALLLLFNKCSASLLFSKKPWITYAGTEAYVPLDCSPTYVVSHNV